MALGWRSDYLRYREQFLNVVKLYRKREDFHVYLEIVLSVVTIIFFSLFALRPTLSTISQLYKDIKTKEEIVGKLDEKIQNLEIAQNLMAERQKTVEIARLSIPGAPTPESFVRQIEGLSAIHSVTLVGVSIGEVSLLGESAKVAKNKEITPLPENAMGMPFSISVTGSYESLYSFLKGFENLRRPPEVDNFSVLSAKLDNGGNKVVMLITGRVPFLKQ